MTAFMKIATWNVNSIRTRLPRLVSWLERRRPDIVCLQEIKVVNEDFPGEELGKLGYHCLVNGQRTYNGVAILSRTPSTDPFFSLLDEAPDAPRRLLAATIEGLRIINVYAPMGTEVGSERYAYKLDWYRRLRDFLDSSAQPDSAVVLCGDFNVAPEDRDVWDPEKEALRKILEWGLKDALRLHQQEGGLYTWWDYRAGAFHRGWGMRLDHILLSAPLAGRCAAVEIDRNERKGEKPSDHVPVVASLQ